MANATYEICVDWYKLVEEGKGLVNVSVTKTLAAAGDYAIGDVMSESAAAGTAWTFSNIVKANGCSGEIVKAQAICETTGLIPSLTLHLFTATPTCALNDNVASTALLHADLANYIGKIDFNAMDDLGGDSESIATPSTYGNLPLAFTCASSANDLYGVLVTRDAITGEVATMDMTIVLTVEQSYEGEDISDDVKSVSFSRGKSDELGKAEVGQLSLTLNNATGKYSPSNAAGTYYGYLLPKRPIQIRATYNFFDYDLFYGFIEEIIPHPHLAEQDCVITAVDGLDYLARHDMSTALYKDKLPGEIHGHILDNAGWLRLARIDDGQDTIPYWYSQDVKARFAQGEVDDTEQGFSLVDGAGRFIFEDRYHRSTSEHQTSQATFDNTMANMTYSLNPRNIYNIVKVTVTPWTIQSLAVVWQLQEIPSIPDGATYTWWGDTDYFIDTWTPINSGATDYTANSLASGLGDNETGNTTVTTTEFAKTLKIEIYNHAGHEVWVTLLRARATYYDSETTVTRKTEDTTSQDTYQKRALVVDGKYMTDAVLAQDYCDYAIGKYKDPRAQLTMTAINQDATTLTQILALEISDRITVDNDKLGIAGDYFIDYMQHDISQSGLVHTVTYRLSDCSSEDFWCLDFSAFPSALGVGSQTKLGY